MEIAPVAGFVVPFGIAFGMAATTRSLPPDISMVMSAAVYAGASQFAVLDLWHAPLPLAMMALTVLAVNARHILLGAAIAPWMLKVPPLRRAAALFFLSDANFAQAMTARARGEHDAGVLLGSGLLMWAAWMIGTAIGAYGGAALGDLTRFGLDVVMVCYFSAMALAQWTGRADLPPWLVAAGVALAGWLLLPPGWHIIAGALAGGLTGARRHGR